MDLSILGLLVCGPITRRAIRACGPKGFWARQKVRAVGWLGSPSMRAVGVFGIKACGPVRLGHGGARAASV